MKYKCSICGYIYDEAQEGVAFAELPEDWQCPLCGAPKSAFEPVAEAAPTDVYKAASKAAADTAAEAVAKTAADSAAVVTTAEQDATGDHHDHAMQQLSIGQMAALCSSLARGCEKQYMPQESALFTELAEWFTRHAPEVSDATVDAVASQLQQGLSDYPRANQLCAEQSDRGALRVLGWSEKATRMLSSLVGRYQREGDRLLADTEIWVCSVCGFVFIGKSAPEQCPVCKVPSWKFNKIERRKSS